MYLCTVPAHFATKNKQISVAKGKQVHVQCNVQGDNPIDIKWKIQNTQQHLDESLDARLVLKNVCFLYFIMVNMWILPSEIFVILKVNDNNL